LLSSIVTKALMILNNMDNRDQTHITNWM